MSFHLFAFKSLWVDFHEKWIIMILLKLVGNLHFALNSDTVMTLDLKNIEFKHAFDVVLLHTVDVFGTVGFSYTYS